MAVAVEFRTGLADRLAYAAGWLRQAAAHRARVRVAASAADLAALDGLLWTAQPGDFIAHATTREDGSYPPGLARTLIWLGSGPVPGDAPTLLLNLGADVADLAGYSRIIELVATAPEATAAGRQRWRWYQAQGLTPTRPT
ncbi:MAG: DNA polymerase III subunit chi [Proteobacteria bacterium]|nr:DNA polymerase III subunit chi [Pseudomonadota bacterium]